MFLILFGHARGVRVRKQPWDTNDNLKITLAATDLLAKH